jgi:hypothetical protein
MTVTVLSAPPTGEQRLLSGHPAGPLPRIDARSLADLLAEASLIYTSPSPREA